MKYLVFLWTVMLISFNTISAQTGEISVIDIDLAKLDEDMNNEIKIDVQDEGLFKIALINALPGMKYNVRIGSKLERSRAKDMEVNTDSKGCSELYEAEKFNLFYEVDEKIIRLIKQKYKENITEYCEEKENRDAYIDSLYFLTERYLYADGIVLKKGEFLDIKIMREPSSLEQKEHVWNVIVIGDGECEETVKEVIIEKPVVANGNGNNGSAHQNLFEADNWRITYGFSFPIMFANDELFYLIQSDSIQNMFEIKKRKDNQYIRFIPSIFLHWSPSEIQGLEWSFSVTGGVGFDSENPIIFSGSSLIYHQKLSFNFGIVVHKVFKLNGKYSDGDLIDLLLDFDQLHEEFYRMNPFIGISFNF